MEPLRLVIFDDNHDFRESLLHLFRFTPDVEVAGVCACIPWWWMCSFRSPVHQSIMKDSFRPESTVLGFLQFILGPKIFGGSTQGSKVCHPRLNK